MQVKVKPPKKMFRESILYGVNSSVQLTEQNLGKLLFEKIRNNDPDGFILIEGDKKITNRDFLKYWRNLTWTLRTIGIQLNDVVALISENSWTCCVCLLSSLALGSPIHLLNPEYTYYELKHLLSLSKPKLIFCTEKSVKNIMKVKEETDFIEFVVMLDEVSKEEEAILFSDAVNVEDVDMQYFADFDPKKQIAMIHNSSGTTGLPKGIQVDHASYSTIYLYQMLQEYSKVSPHESYLLYLPIFHGYGTYLALAGFCVSNTTGIIMKKFCPEDFFSSIANYKVRSINVVPTILNFMANTSLDQKYNLSSLKEIICSGAASREVDNKKVCEKYNIKCIRNLYGMGEGAVCISIMPKNEYKKRCVGKLFPDRQLKIVDKTHNKTLGPNEVGEICVKNPVMHSYVNDVVRTKEVFDSDGFMYTGDAGYYDENGYIYLVDRLKDLIKYKCYQVAPTELELILQQHPAVKDVAVVGKPDERAGELTVAFIVKKKDCDITEKEIQDYLSEYVSIQKQLHGGVKFVEEIPKNPTGKILRRHLRDRICREQEM